MNDPLKFMKNGMDQSLFLPLIEDICNNNTEVVGRRNRSIIPNYRHGYGNITGVWRNLKTPLFRI